MSVAPGDPVFQLHAGVTSQMRARRHCFDLFHCCLPSKRECDQEDQDEPDCYAINRDLNFNELVHEDELFPDVSNGNADKLKVNMNVNTNTNMNANKNKTLIHNNSVLVAFLHVLLSLLLFNFNSVQKTVQSDSPEENKNNDTNDSKEQLGTDKNKKTDTESANNNDVSQTPPPPPPKLDTHAIISEEYEDEYEIQEIPDIPEQE